MPFRLRFARLLAVGSLFVFVLALGACSSKPTPPATVSPDVWAVVDGREIRRNAVESAYRRVADLNATPSDEEAMMAKLNLLNEMITQDLMVAKAKALGLEPTAAEVDAAFDERQKSLTEAVLQKQLSQRGLTTADLKEDLRRELTTQKLVDHEVNSKVTVSEQTIIDYFNANRRQFNLSEPGYHIAQIVVTPGRDAQITNRQNDDATTPDAAARKAKMIADRLLGGAKFSELAMDYSEDPQTAAQGGDLGLVSASQLQQAPPALRDTVLKGQPGTISQVNIGGTYTIVLIVSKEPAGQRDLSTPGVRDNITAMLRERQQQLLQTAFVAAIRNDARVVNQLAAQIVAKPAPPVSMTPAPPGKKTP